MAWLNGEAAASTVRDAFASARAGQLTLQFSAINAGEVYYLLAKRRSRKAAEQWHTEVLPSLPIRVVVPTLDDILEAAKLKAAFPISYADSFAAGLALKHHAALVTGDTEFRSIPNLQIVWIGP